MPQPCPKCGKPVPEHAPNALCPACLLGGGDSTTLVSREAVMPHGQFEPGTVLIERYRIVSLLGKGGMGEVYRADDLFLKEPVALKILPEDLGNRASILEALRNEVRQARLVSHRSVCRVHDIGEIDGQPILSMEFIEGEDLASLLRRIGQLPAQKAYQLAIQLAEGLEAAHEQDVLHLDLKPANLMINREGNLKISDFGLARIASIPEENRGISGTPAYMAPEQALGNALGKQTDIYAFGLILFEMLTGERPYKVRQLDEVRNMHQVGTDVPALPQNAAGAGETLENLIKGCLAPRPEDRLESFAEIAERLRSSSQANPSPKEPDQRADSTIEESDVYLSFAPIDDQPLSPDKKGWISQFHRNLEVRVEQLSGKQVRVFRPTRSQNEDGLNTEILDNLPHVKAMVSVVSPPFVNSPGCLREVNAYWDSNASDGRLFVDGHTRVLKVVKTPVEDNELPAELRDKLGELFGFDFFEYDPTTGRLKEFADWAGSEAEQRFHERIYDLAQEINALFRALAKSPKPSGNGKTVYLATTTSDIAPLRDRIRRELIGRGHRVLPERPLPVVASEAEAIIKANLAESDLTIHAFGQTYGVIPEGAQTSLASLQNTIAAEHSKQTDLPRIIWIPDDVTPGDERQGQLMHQLKTDPEFHCNAEIIVNTFQNLKPIVLDKLNPVTALPAPKSDTDGSTRTRRIYLICDPKDEEAIEPLEDYLYDQGFDVCLPDFEANEAEAAQSHRENLQESDGVIVYYGAARNAWVDVKLRNIQKMTGYGREEELAFSAIYIAPPFDRRKERYRTHSAEIIRQPAEFEPSLVQPLVDCLRNS